MNVEANREGRLKSRLQRGILTFMAAIPVLLIPTLEYLPWIPDNRRSWFILPSLAIATVGFVLLNRNERQLERLAFKNKEMREGIERAEPEYLLRQIASTIFAEGAWRLSVYKKAHSPRPGPGDHLVRLASVASDGDQGVTGASTICITPSTMFEFSFQSNLADSRFRRAEQSGAGPDDVHSDTWLVWRDGIFGQGAVIGDTSTFRARKFAWYAAQDPETQEVFVSIAESAAPEGIMVDSLDHSLTPAWLFSVPRLAELRNTMS